MIAGGKGTHIFIPKYVWTSGSSLRGLVAREQNVGMNSSSIHHLEIE